jgi:hypothetical protein
MSFAPIITRAFEFTPADYAQNEVKTLITLPQGAVILASAGLILEAFNGTGAKVEVGITTTDADGLIDEDDWDESVALTYAAGLGALVVGAGVQGLYYVVDSTRDQAINFTAGTDGTTGKAVFYVAYFHLSGK